MFRRTTLDADFATRSEHGRFRILRLSVSKMSDVLRGSALYGTHMFCYRCSPLPVDAKGI